jgi:hypothetical protein
MIQSPVSAHRDSFHATVVGPISGSFNSQAL